MNDPPHHWSTEPPLPSVQTAEPGSARSSSPPSSSSAATRPAAPAPSHPAFALRVAALSELELNAVVGPGTTIQGTLSFAGKIRIEGEVEGQIKGGKLLIIGPGARVVGRIEAEQVIVLGGIVDADIIASESIELYIPSQVAGDLKCPQIYMDRGIRFQGTCDMTGSPPLVEPRTLSPQKWGILP